MDKQSGRKSYPARTHYTGGVAHEYLARRDGEAKWILENEAVARLLKDLPAATRILDAPMGTARFHELYHDLNLSPFGLDVSLSMLEQAPEAMRGLMVRGDIASLPFADYSVDYVLSVRFLNWLPPVHLEAALSEFKRVARQGLIVGIRTRERIRPSHLLGFLKSIVSRPLDSFGRLTAPLRRRLLGDEPSIIIPPNDEVFDLFDRLQLEIVSSETIPDRSEYTRRAFRHTPLRILRLHPSHSPTSTA